MRLRAAIVPHMRYLPLLLVSCVVGCTGLFTGFDVREAAETRDILQSEESSLHSSIQSTHAGTTVLLQTGASLTPGVEPGDAPTITTEDGGFAYYRNSDPSQVLDAYAKSVEAVARSYMESLRLIETLISRKQDPVE